MNPENQIAERGRSLYDLTGEWRELNALLEQTGGDLDHPHDGRTLAEWLKEHNVLALNKIIGYYYVYRNWETVAEAFEAEETRFAQARMRAENNIERLKKALKEYMVQTTTIKIGGAEHGLPFTIWTQRNGRGKLRLKVAPEQLPRRFQKITIEENDPVLREALLADDPEAQAVAELEEPGISLRIK